MGAATIWLLLNAMQKYLVVPDVLIFLLRSNGLVCCWFCFYHMKISQWLNVGNELKKCFQYCATQTKPSEDLQ